MAHRIWDGTGEVADDEAYFTTDDGTIRGRPYVQRRVQRALSRWARFYTREQRARAIADTVGNDAWMSTRHGVLVSCICREAVDYLFLNP